MFYLEEWSKGVKSRTSGVRKITDLELISGKQSKETKNSLDLKELDISRARVEW